MTDRKKSKEHKAHAADPPDPVIANLPDHWQDDKGNKNARLISSLIRRKKRWFTDATQNDLEILGKDKESISIKDLVVVVARDAMLRGTPESKMLAARTIVLAEGQNQRDDLSGKPRHLIHEVKSHGPISAESQRAALLGAIAEEKRKRSIVNRPASGNGSRLNGPAKPKG